MRHAIAAALLIAVSFVGVATAQPALTPPDPRRSNPATNPTITRVSPQQHPEWGNVWILYHVCSQIPPGWIAGLTMALDRNKLDDIDVQTVKFVRDALLGWNGDFVPCTLCSSGRLEKKLDFPAPAPTPAPPAAPVVVVPQ